MLIYSAYLGFGIMLPGTLLWRWLRGNVDGFAADVAFGTGFGFVASILTYIPGRMIGVPLLPLVVPVATITAFLVAPGLRGHWRSRQPPVAWWWAWSVAAAAVLALWVITRNGLMIEPIAFPDADFQYGDMPYQLALAGEVANHLPGRIPYVVGQPLNYHWFLHAEVAAAHWQTGLDMDLLLRRLLPVTTALVPVLAVAALASRLARRSWVGPVAAWLLLLVTGFEAYGWRGGDSMAQAAYSSGVLMLSLTHAFGVVIALPVIWLVLSLLRGEGVRNRGNWVLLAAGLLGLAGAKASFVPMIAAGLGLVVVSELLLRRRVDKWILALAGAGLLAFAFGQVVLFSAGSSGAALSPGHTFVGASTRLGFAGHYGSHLDVLVAIGTTAVALLASWALAGIGMLGFLRNRHWQEPAAVFLVGYLVAGLATAALFRHPGSSQIYFVRAAFPVAIAASVWGLTLVLGHVRPRVLLPSMLAAFGIGLLAARALIQLTPRRPSKGQGVPVVAWQIIWPWLAVLLVVVLVLLLLRYGPRRWPTRGLAVGLSLVVVLGAASIKVPRLVLSSIGRPICVSGPERPECRHPKRNVPAGGAAAARYIRDNSDVDDLLATNSHCVPVYTSRTCDARGFWLSAYAERRVLVEGWAYTPQAQRRVDGGAAIIGPFWDQPLLAANDKAFRNATRSDLDYLRGKYGVRWLVFDTLVSRPSDEVTRLLPKRFAAGSVEVFELVPLPDGTSSMG